MEPHLHADHARTIMVTAHNVHQRYVFGVEMDFMWILLQEAYARHVYQQFLCA